jgi:hypothetical protein
VKASVDKPKYGWGDVAHGHIGVVARLGSGDVSMKADFPKYSGWLADPAEMEKVCD